MQEASWNFFHISFTSCLLILKEVLDGPKIKSYYWFMFREAMIFAPEQTSNSLNVARNAER